MLQVFKRDGLDIPKRLEKNYQKAIEILETHPLSHGLNFEKLSGKIFSIRLNRSDRLLLTRTDEGYEIVDVIEHHHYSKSSFYRDSVFRKQQVQGNHNHSKPLEAEASYDTRVLFKSFELFLHLLQHNGSTM